MSEKLTTAIMLACEAHDGQTDRNGEPYILHPLRVMQAMSSETDRIVAVLHDVAEDFDAGWGRITDGDFSEDVVDAIDALTRRKGEPYSDFILRAAENDIARRVKIADVRDNLRPGTPHLQGRYQKAFEVLEGKDKT